MAKSRRDIQKQSDAKRGVAVRSYQLDITTIARIDALCKQLGKTKRQLLLEMVELYEREHGINNEPTEPI